MRRYMQLAFLGLLIALTPLLMGPVTADNRSFSAGKYALELDGVHMGWLQSAEGGHATADVVSEAVAADQLKRKHLGNVKYEEITITVGADMTAQFYDWIKSASENKTTRKSGAIIAADFDYKEFSRVNFTDAIITEFAMPALDASSKDAAKMTIKFQPETTKYQLSSTGKPLMKPTASKQKQWLSANFRLRINGLDDSAASRVNKIEALTIKQK